MREKSEEEMLVDFRVHDSMLQLNKGSQSMYVIKVQYERDVCFD